MINVRSVIFDIKLHIASFDAKAWYHLYCYDPEFRIYSDSVSGQRYYTELFTEVRLYINKNFISIEKWSLFNKRHRQPNISGESLPAVTKSIGVVEYYINGKLHRNGDHPAYTRHRLPICDNELINLQNDLDYNSDRYGYYCDQYYKTGQLHRDDDPDGNELPAICWDDGKLEYYKNGQLHRNSDNPAIIFPNGEKHYYKNNNLHRDVDENGREQPAVYADWHIKYYQNGVLHRNEDEPSVICNDGEQIYYQNGKVHRDGDKPAHILACGTLRYFINDKLHRENDQPAIIHSIGTLEYYKHGKRHRDKDQPAVICALHRKIVYYVDGKKHRYSGANGNKRPAVLYHDGYAKYYTNGECSSIIKKKLKQRVFQTHLAKCTQWEIIMNIFGS